MFPILNPPPSSLPSWNHSWWPFPAAAAAAKSLQLCLTLCDPIDVSLPGSPVPGILQARKLDWVAISFSNAWKWKEKVKSLSRAWILGSLWDPMDCSPPGSSVHGICQTRVLEWGAIAFSVVSLVIPKCPSHLFYIPHDWKARQPALTE